MVHDKMRFTKQYQTRIENFFINRKYFRLMNKVLKKGEGKQSEHYVNVTAINGLLRSTLHVDGQNHPNASDKPMRQDKKAPTVKIVTNYNFSMT